MNDELGRKPDENHRSAFQEGSFFDDTFYFGRDEVINPYY
jgi:hypothetical protein